MNAYKKFTMSILHNGQLATPRGVKTVELLGQELIIPADSFCWRPGFNYELAKTEVKQTLERLLRLGRDCCDQ